MTEAGIYVGYSTRNWIESIRGKLFLWDIFTSKIFKRVVGVISSISHNCQSCSEWLCPANLIILGMVIPDYRNSCTRAFPRSSVIGDEIQTKDNIYLFIPFCDITMAVPWPPPHQLFNNIVITRQLKWLRPLSMLKSRQTIWMVSFRQR